MTHDEELEALLDEEQDIHDEWWAGLSPADRKAYEAYMEAGSLFTGSFQEWLEQQ